MSTCLPGSAIYLKVALTYSVACVSSRRGLCKETKKTFTFSPNFKRKFSRVFAKSSSFWGLLLYTSAVATTYGHWQCCRQFATIFIDHLTADCHTQMVRVCTVEWSWLRKDYQILGIKYTTMTKKTCLAISAHSIYLLNTTNKKKSSVLNYYEAIVVYATSNESYRVG